MRAPDKYFSLAHCTATDSHLVLCQLICRPVDEEHQQSQRLLEGDWGILKGLWESPKHEIKFTCNGLVQPQSSRSLSVWVNEINDQTPLKLPVSLNSFVHGQDCLGIDACFIEEKDNGILSLLAFDGVATNTLVNNTSHSFRKII